MIKYIFIDLDNTLIDFNKCAFFAMKTGFEENNLEFKNELFETFTLTNNELWKKLEKCEITKEQLRFVRWNLIFERLGIENCDGHSFETRFENIIAESAFHVDGAEALIKYLAEKYKVFVVTNGFLKTQQNRVKIGGFSDYLSGLFVSEKIGFPKPQKEFFDYCINETGIKEKSEVALIGDSLSADISGGVDYGFTTIWFNAAGEEAPKSFTPSHTVKTLGEIMNIL